MEKSAAKLESVGNRGSIRTRLSKMEEDHHNMQQNCTMKSTLKLAACDSQQILIPENSVKSIEGMVPNTYLCRNKSCVMVSEWLVVNKEI